MISAAAELSSSICKQTPAFIQAMSEKKVVADLGKYTNGIWWKF